MSRFISFSDPPSPVQPSSSLSLNSSLNEYNDDYDEMLPAYNAIKRFENLVELGGIHSYGGSAFRDRLSSAFDLMIERTQDFTDSPYTTHEHRQKILLICHELRQQLNQLLRIGSHLEEEEEGEGSAGEDIETALIQVIRGINGLKHQLNMTALIQSEELFKLTDEIDLIHRLKGSLSVCDSASNCNNRSPDPLMAQRFVQEDMSHFAEHCDQLEEVCKLLFHISPTEQLQSMAKCSEGQLWTYRPQIVTATHQLSMHPSSPNAQLHLHRLLQLWFHLFQDIQRLSHDVQVTLQQEASGTDPGHLSPSSNMFSSGATSSSSPAMMPPPVPPSTSSVCSVGPQSLAPPPPPPPSLLQESMRSHSPHLNLMHHHHPLPTGHHMSHLMGPVSASSTPASPYGDRTRSIASLGAHYDAPSAPTLPCDYDHSSSSLSIPYHSHPHHPHHHSYYGSRPPLPLHPSHPLHHGYHVPHSHLMAPGDQPSSSYPMGHHASPYNQHGVSSSSSAPPSPYHRPGPPPPPPDLYHPQSQSYETRDDSYIPYDGNNYPMDINPEDEEYLEPEDEEDPMSLRWPNSENNDIVKRAKTMCTMAQSMIQFTRGQGDLKTTQDLFTQAEFFAEEANKFYKVVRHFTYQVPSGGLKKDLLEHLDKVPTFVQQLQFAVKNSTVGKAATFTKVDNVIQETNHLMDFVTKTVDSCIICSSKYNIEMVSKGKGRAISPSGRVMGEEDDALGYRGEGGGDMSYDSSPRRGRPKQTTSDGDARRTRVSFLLF